jgi:HEAT repeat protein
VYAFVLLTPIGFAQQESSDKSEQESEIATAGEPRKPAPTTAAHVTREDAWSVLSTGCQEEKDVGRAAATRALGLIPNNAQARKMAEEALKDDNADVRLAAADALGEMKARASIPKLRTALRDSDPPVVLAAAHALELMNVRAAYRIYYEVLAGDRKARRGLLASQTSALKDPKKIATLGIKEGATFVPYGSMGWTAVKMFTRNDSAPARASAAHALANDPDPSATRALTDALGDKSWLVRLAALESLARRNNPAALDAVRLYVYDERDAVRYTASAAVVRLTAIREPQARSDRKNQRGKKR